jgi:hypothetical protein
MISWNIGIICFIIHFFLLRSESNLHFQLLEGADAGCLTLCTRRNSGWFRTFIKPRPYYALLPKAENEDLTLILREKNGNLCRYKCFQCWCKGEKHENNKANSIYSSIVAILELIRGAQCLIEVIGSSGEEMWRVDGFCYSRYLKDVLQ